MIEVQDPYNENFKTLKKLKKTSKNRKNFHAYRLQKTVLLNVIYRLNIFSIKILVSFFIELGKKILKYGSKEKTQIPKAILSIKSSAI